MNPLSRALARVKQVMNPVGSTGAGWWNMSSTIRESFPGAWQQNVEISSEQSLANFAVFACMTRIAQDIAKIGFLLEEQSDDGIWSEVDGVSPFRRVLDKPNQFQNHVQFKESWILSKLARGNTYALKQRDDQRGLVTALHILHPDRVQPLVTPDGEIYYSLNADNLAGLSGSSLVVPASEIIHDRFNCLFHPLVGISPLYAACMAAGNGLAIQKNSSSFFANASMPGGIISLPQEVPQTIIDEVKKVWNDNYTGVNAGKVAVLSGGMTYVPTRTNASDSQLIEQLKMTAQIICSVFHVPAYQIGMEVAPASRLSVEALEIDYYTKCLQLHIEAMEASLTDGLEVSKGASAYRVSLDLDGLTRMDTSEKSVALSNLTKAGIMSPNEARAKFNLAPVKGGDSPYLQQQEYSLEALSQRDATNPLAVPPPAPPVAEVTPPATTGPEDDPIEAVPTKAFAEALSDLLKRDLIRE